MLFFISILLRWFIPAVRAGSIRFSCREGEIFPPARENRDIAENNEREKKCVHK
jgi:hypothetical protein